MMKSSMALNSHLEYFVLFDKIVDDSQASRLFEKYGEFVSRRLGIHLSWLGSVQLEKGREPLSRLALDALFMDSSNMLHSVEKRAVAEYLLQIQSFSRGYA